MLKNNQQINNITASKLIIIFWFHIEQLQHSMLYRYYSIYNHCECAWHYCIYVHHYKRHTHTAAGVMHACSNDTSNIRNSPLQAGVTDEPGSEYSPSSLLRVVVESTVTW